MTDSEAPTEKPEEERNKPDDNTSDVEKGSAQDEPQLPAKPDQTLKNTTSGKDEAFKVRFEEGDPENPRNWSNLYKAWITIILGLLAYVNRRSYRRRS
jgi:DHA1 family multidrug resistance protein-like MFS transporter